MYASKPICCCKLVGVNGISRGKGWIFVSLCVCLEQRRLSMEAWQILGPGTALGFTFHCYPVLMSLCAYVGSCFYYCCLISGIMALPWDRERKTQEQWGSTAKFYSSTASVKHCISWHLVTGQCASVCHSAVLLFLSAFPFRGRHSESVTSI